MNSTASGPSAIRLGDPAPAFAARSVQGASIDSRVDAGRWLVLAFLGDLTTPRAAQEVAALLGEAQLFREDHLVVYGILTAAPPAEMLVHLTAISGPALAFIADYDGAITRAFGADVVPRTIVLDPLQCVIANIDWQHPSGHEALLRNVLRGLPAVDESAGVPLSAPALIVPRVFDFALCDFLVELYDKMGGEDSGFLLDQGGKTGTVINHRLKRRQDLVIADPQLRDMMRDQIVRRLLPAVERFFQFSPTRMDRYMVSCYDSALGGHFYRHRDNVNAGAQHRRFAVSLNLNRDYDGCDLVFPEFGRRTYRAPVGGAIVFSCGALHEVTPIVRGKRYVFVPFLYGEADASRREANNARLQDGETHYVGGLDMLFPPVAAE